MKRYIPLSSYLLLAFVALFCLACSKKAPDPSTPTSTSNVKINPQAKLVSATVVSNQLIVQDSTTFLFKTSSSFGQTVAVNDILVADTSRTFPYGMLKKVVNKTTVGDRIVISTVNSSLNDLILSANIHFEQTYGQEDLKGGRAVTSEISQDLTWVFFDADGDKETKDDQVSISGMAKSKPKFVFDWEKEEGSAQPSEIRVGYESENELTAKLRASFGNFEKKVPLKKFSLPPVRILVGEFPIIFRNYLIFSVAAKVTSPLKEEVGVTSSFTSSAFLHFQNDIWNYESSRSNDQFKSILPTVESKNAGAKFSVINLELETHPYGLELLNMGAAIDAGVGITVTCPQWKTNYYINGEVSAKADFSEFIAGLKVDKKWEFELAQFPIDSGKISCDDAIGYMDVTTVKKSDNKLYYRFVFVPTDRVATGLTNGVFYLFDNIYGPIANANSILDGDVTKTVYLPNGTVGINPSGIYSVYIGGLKRVGNKLTDACYSSKTVPIGVLSFSADGYASTDIHYTVPITTTDMRGFICDQ